MVICPDCHYLMPSNTLTNTLKSFANSSHSFGPKDLLGSLEHTSTFLTSESPQLIEQAINFVNVLLDDITLRKNFTQLTNRLGARTNYDSDDRHCEDYREVKDTIRYLAPRNMTKSKQAKAICALIALVDTLSKTNLAVFGTLQTQLKITTVYRIYESLFYYLTNVT